MAISIVGGGTAGPALINRISNIERNTSIRHNLFQQWNSKIEADHQIALQILKPSKKELDRGLALYEESVVFDTYGFMPRAAYDGDVIAAAIENCASELEFKDLKED